MPAAAAEAFRAWHDFYVLIGTAAATLVGAMFVVASIGSNMMTRKHAPQIRAFLTPTVIHLSVVVLAAAVAMVPSLDWLSLAVLFAGAGAAGIGYSLLVGWRVVNSHVDWGDRIWYALLPIVGYAVILAASLTIFLHSVPSFEALAAGLVLLLVAGVRNSWDMIVFFSSRDPEPGRDGPG